jgi:hypothetical protein
MLLEAFMSLMCVLFLETLSIRRGASRDVHSRSSLSFTKAAHFSSWSNVNDVTLACIIGFRSAHYTKRSAYGEPCHA